MFSDVTAAGNKEIRLRQDSKMFEVLSSALKIKATSRESYINTSVNTRRVTLADRLEDGTVAYCLIMGKGFLLTVKGTKRVTFELALRITITQLLYVEQGKCL